VFLHEQRKLLDRVEISSGTRGRDGRHVRLSMALDRNDPLSRNSDPGSNVEDFTCR
jgi:hypothetical protein